MAQQARRQRPLYAQPLPDRARDDVLTDGKTEGKLEQPSVSPSVHPSSTGRPRARRLTSNAQRLVDWIEYYAVGAIPKESRPAAVADRAGRGAFVGGRLFVLKYGSALIHEALNEMTYHLDFTLGKTGGERRYWRDAIVSPAQYLHWMVQQLAATGEGEERAERRLRVVDERAGR